MRKVLLLGILSSFSSLAYSVPNCWNQRGVDDGAYLVGINTKTVSKEQLLEILSKVNENYLHATSYPVVSKNRVLIETIATGSPRMAKSKLKAMVEMVLQNIEQIPGVDISCRVKYFPR